MKKRLLGVPALHLLVLLYQVSTADERRAIDAVFTNSAHPSADAYPRTPGLRVRRMRVASDPEIPPQPTVFQTAV